MALDDKIIMSDFKREMERAGYSGVRQMKNGEWVGILKMNFTWGLFVGLDDSGYKKRYCYEHLTDAFMAVECYEGVGDPSGSWIKVKGEGRERMGPGAKEGGV